MSETRRVRVRLTHSLPADAEIHTMLPDTLDEFDAAFERGDLGDLRARLDDVAPAEATHGQNGPAGPAWL